MARPKPADAPVTITVSEFAMVVTLSDIHLESFEPAEDAYLVLIRHVTDGVNFHRSDEEKTTVLEHR
jgi:hypothetical protein